MENVKYWARLLVIVLVLLFLYSQDKLPPPVPGEVPQTEIDYLSYLQEVFSEADSYEYADEVDEWSVVLDSEGNNIGYFISTTPYLDNIRGYAGPVPVLIAADKNGYIKGTVLLPHDETPSFMISLEEESLLEKWDGRSLEEAARLEVDTVSGATMSSRAIIQKVQSRLEMAGYELTQPARLSGMALLRILALFLVLFAALAGFFHWFGAHRIRVPILILNVLILGFWTTQLLSLAFFRSSLMTGIPWQSQPFMVILLVCAVLFPIVSGKNFYCTYVCPYGALQKKKKKIYSKGRIKLPRKLIPFLRHLRLIYLLALLGLVISPLSITLENWEPFAAFRFRVASISTIAIAITGVVLSFYLPRIWCQFGCPTGQVLDLLKRKRKVKPVSQHKDSDA